MQGKNLFAKPCCLGTGLFFLLFSCAVPGALQHPPEAAVVSAHALATEAGITILEQGGNAFDAAVAVSAALAVVEPYASGLGGGGFWLLHRASDQRQVFIDGRETAPGASHGGLFLDENGQLDRERALNHPLSAGIPGTVAALAHLQEHYGSLPMATLLAPAIRLAREGFPVTRQYLRLLEWRRDVLVRYPDSAAVFLPDGQAPAPGRRIVQTDLARVLARIAEYGAEDFYRGAVARQLLAGVRAAGGIWQARDLDEYAVVEREPLLFHYRGLRVVSAPPPSAGGVVLAQALQMLSGFDWHSLERAEAAHLVVEALRRAYQDRAYYLGDPGYVNIPLETLLAPDYLARRAASISRQTATASSWLDASRPGLVPARARSTNTTHFSILDREGNRVAATLSINLPFGSGFLVPGTGILLNNELDDFALLAGTPNSYQLPGNEANALEPGKRPLSSMSPSFVEAPDRVAILGTPGGSRIISMVLLAILDVAADQPPDAWVRAPRYHHQFLPDQLLFEPEGFNSAEQQLLRSKGHTLKEHSRRYGNMQAILWLKNRDRVLTGSDPRGIGLGTTTAATGRAPAPGD